MSIGGNKSKTTSNQATTDSNTTTTTLDPRFAAAVYDNYQRTQGLAAQPYQAYGGERTAGFTPTQVQAQAMTGDIATGRVGDAALNQGLAGAQSAAGYAPSMVDTSAIGAADISNLMNPYAAQVVDASLADIERQKQEALNQNRARAAAAHSFGGAGDALLQAQTQQAFANTAASTGANLRAQGFDTALGAAQADRARQLSAQQANQSAGLAGAQNQLAAAGLLGSLSNQQLSQAATRAGLLGQVGDAQQALAQSADDAGYQDYLAAQNWPLQMQQLLNASLGLVPETQTTTSNGAATLNSIGKTSGSNWSYAPSVSAGGVTLKGG